MDGDFMQENSTNNTSQVASSEYIITLKFLVSIFCILSIAGSLLIIIAYIAFKETRTLARQLLVNLAVADFVTALANLVGLLTNFERFHLRDENYDHDQSKWISIYCTVQAFFAQFGTDSSILWTIVVTVYLLSAIVLKKHNITSKLLPFYYIISWGIPLVIMIWFAVVGFLGFEPNTTPGWCAIKSEPSYAVAVGYTAFVYIAFVILPIISVVIISYTRITQRRAGYDPQVQSITRSIDLKLILIPLIFVGLRIWGVVVDLFTFQIGDAALKENFVHSIAGLILIVLKGVGDSSQGFANSILFIGLTPSIRKRFSDVLIRIFRNSKCFRRKDSISMTSVVSETASLLNKPRRTGYSTALNDDTTQSVSSTTSSVLTYEIHHN